MSTEGSVKWKDTTSTKVVGSVLYFLVINITSLIYCVCMLPENNMHLDHQTIPPVVQKWDRDYTSSPSLCVTLAQWVLPCEW